MNEARDDGFRMTVASAGPHANKPPPHPQKMWEGPHFIVPGTLATPLLAQAHIGLDSA